MKLYNIGLVVGRFQMLHNGHVSIIKAALELCDRVVVYVGSSQEYGTEHNPYCYLTREDMITRVFSSECASKKLLIRPLPDIGVGNNDIWGRYVLGAFEAEFHRQPDLYVTGCEKERPSWFTNELAPNMDELRISRHSIDISATECRKLVKQNKFDEWCKYVDYAMYDKFDYYKRILDEVKERKK